MIGIVWCVLSVTPHDTPTRASLGLTCVSHDSEMERELGEEDRLAAVDGAQDRTAQTRPAVFEPQLPPVDLGPLASRFGLHCPAHLQRKIIKFYY